VELLVKADLLPVALTQLRRIGDQLVQIMALPELNADTQSERDAAVDFLVHLLHVLWAVVYACGCV